ncbi:winged helix-turn-helix transcriptional regulator [Novispirillum sp. DQ9]|uniref:winged helix-turn-helix transcriptional regulator n=1 Tax=Novispirillum sp. DQ9 TaxID=3398612 RepID=UPI003C7ADE34
METHSYNQFCPVALAAEVLCSRWTILVVRELIAGRSRFNEMRRGLCGMSPGLLSKRLRQLEAAGVVEHGLAADGVTPEYHLTPAGRDLRPLVEDLGAWGERWLYAAPSLRSPDAAALMGDMRRALQGMPLPCDRCVIQFVYPDQKPPRRNWWVLAERPRVDICVVDPGVAPQVYVVADLRVMTAVWMGLAGVAEECRAGRLTVTGEAAVGRMVRDWLGGEPLQEPRSGALGP